jgi:2-polyprenyl-3-methyl-5-hydroxy-6-metoxy-1,4-benzoquinol methylase
VIYQDEYDQLIDICKQVTSHKQLLAKPRIEQLILDYVDEQVANPLLLAHLIAESLMRRIDRRLVESKNIFVQEFDVPQIELFYSMAEAVPFVYVGHQLANMCLEQAVQELPFFTILDIGIGNGGQVKKLLDRLAQRGGRLELVRVIGLDPREENLVNSRALLEQAGRDYPFEVVFQPVCKLVEHLTNEEFDSIRENSKGNLVINSAFTFHHTAHPLNDQLMRTDLLRRLASLKPKILTLVEPNSNHDTEELTKRVHHSWEHFGNVFALVDESGIDISHKYLIKGKFFAREIRDIFGVSDHFRCERHELYDSWLLRLFKAGYKPFALGELPVQLPRYCQYTIADGLVRLNYKDITIVAMMAFTA